MVLFLSNLHPKMQNWVKNLEKPMKIDQIDTISKLNHSSRNVDQSKSYKTPKQAHPMPPRLELNFQIVKVINNSLSSLFNTKLGHA